MANAEGINSADILFRGIDGNECEAFVVALRELAFAEGKDGDHYWMLRYATTRLRGRALRWHAKLDPSVQNDWYLFVQALFEEYPLVEERRDEGGVATPVWTSTTFSPAPSTIALSGNDLHAIAPIVQPSDKEGVAPDSFRPQRPLPLDGIPIPPQQYNPSLPTFQVGRLRIEYGEGRPEPHYIWRGRDHDGSRDFKMITTNIHEALIVSFAASSEPHQILCMNSREREAWCLGVQLFSVEKSEFHPLIGTQDPAPPCYRNIRYLGSESRYQFVSDIWNVLSDGTLRATLGDLSNDPANSEMQIISESYCTTTAYAEISGASVSFAKDYSTAKTLHPSSGRPIVRARIVFEPI